MPTMHRWCFAMQGDSQFMTIFEMKLPSSTAYLGKNCQLSRAIQVSGIDKQSPFRDTIRAQSYYNAYK